MTKAEREAFRAAARRLFHKEGEIEIDDAATVSADAAWRSEGEGAYVKAWVWVPAEEAKRETCHNCGGLHGRDLGDLCQHCGAEAEPAAPVCTCCRHWRGACASERLYGSGIACRDTTLNEKRQELNDSIERARR